ncbi:hypothetical protein JCM15519_04150 [Fundidesulfovibrio butyratiphilus]
MTISREAFYATVQPDDLEGHLREVAEYCGVETAIRLWEFFPGATISIRKQALKQAAVRYIREHYDGNNVAALVRATGFAERFVYDVAAASAIKPDQNVLPGCETS